MNIWICISCFLAGGLIIGLIFKGDKYNNTYRKQKIKNSSDSDINSAIIGRQEKKNAKRTRRSAERKAKKFLKRLKSNEK